MRPAPSVIRSLISPYIVRSRMTGRNAVSQMADDLRRLAATADSILADDMLLAGWTQAQINSYGHEARRIALQRDVRVDSGSRANARRVAKCQAGA